MAEHHARSGARALPEAGAIKPGSELAGYRIESLLGRGAMSVVYLAEDMRFDREVALKLLAPRLERREAFLERFLKESERASALDHANVVPVYETGEAEGLVFIAMRYVAGSDLARMLRAGRMPPQRAIELAAQVATTLDTAREHGLVHGDVKPSNILVDASDNAHLADFRLTTCLQEAGRLEEALRGTVDYIAPEQIEGAEVDHRADQYSLGCLLYECLVGDPPFRRDSDAATVFAHLAHEPPGPPGLEGVFRTALAKTPGGRYASSSELVEAAWEALKPPTAP